MNQKGNCYPSIKRLAYNLNISEQAARKRLKKLKKRKNKGKPVITVTQKKVMDGSQKWSNNVYQLSESTMNIISMGKRYYKKTADTKVLTAQNEKNLSNSQITRENSKKAVDTKAGNGFGSSKQYPENNNNKQHAAAQVQELLSSWGANTETINNLLEKHPTDKVLQMAEQTTHKPGVKNKTGYLIAALSKNYDLQPTKEAQAIADANDEMEYGRQKTAKLLNECERSNNSDMLDTVRKQLHNKGFVKEKPPDSKGD